MGETDASGDKWAVLMARAQDGDGACYQRLLADIAPYIRALAARHHRERADVEDSVQDILLTLHRIRHTYDPARPFKPWLAAIAKRRIIDRLRLQGRRRARETALGPEHETFTDPSANTYEAQPELRALKEAVAQLPEGQRQAVTMLKLEEKTLKEASNASGMSIAALKVSSHRAVKTLRRLLDKGAGHVTATDDLIRSLSAEAEPVRRLRPPLVRASLWLMAFACVVGAVTLATGAWPAMLVRLHGGRFAAEMAATFLTGIAAVIAAFYVSLPDRSRFWLALPLPPLVLWLALSGYGCYREWVLNGPEGWQWGRSANCFAFILGTSIPTAVALYLALRRALPLEPLRVMAAGGLGVAALAAATLQFYHPFEVTFLDLGVHIAAVFIVVAAMMVTGAGLARMRG